MKTKVLTGETESLLSCELFLKKKYHFESVFLTNSCTMALEMSAVAAEIQPGDEVIMPSFTFVSTANAFALRGAKIIFVDSKKDHPNMDESKIERLITNKTKAVVVVHYGGVSCDLSTIMSIANKYNLLVIEDAAQGINSFYKNRPLGSIGDIGCFSFHETKNIHCGEGGCLVVNKKSLISKIEIIRHKGTNRTAFDRGSVRQYEWLDLGFSSMPSAISSAFLFAQLEHVEDIQERRLELWNNYFNRLKVLQDKNFVKLPVLPEFATNIAHLFYMVCNSEKERNDLISYLLKNEIQAVFHYQALHSSPIGVKLFKGEALPNAENFSNCLIRLPLFYELTETEQKYICLKVIEFYSDRNVRN